MLRAENKQRKGRGGGRERGGKAEWRDGQRMKCKCSLLSLPGTEIYGRCTWHGSSSEENPSLSLPFSMSLFISLPLSWSHRSCSSPGPLAAPARRGPQSRLTRTNHLFKGTLRLFNAQIHEDKRGKFRIRHCFLKLNMQTRMLLSTIKTLSPVSSLLTPVWLSPMTQGRFPKFAASSFNRKSHDFSGL